MGTSGYIRFYYTIIGGKWSGTHPELGVVKKRIIRSFYNHYDSYPSKKCGLGFRLLKFIRNLYTIDNFLIRKTNYDLYRKIVNYSKSIIDCGEPKGLITKIYLPSQVFYVKLYKKTRNTNHCATYSYQQPLLSLEEPDFVNFDHSQKIGSFIYLEIKKMHEGVLDHLDNHGILVEENPQYGDWIYTVDDYKYTITIEKNDEKYVLSITDLYMKTDDELLELCKSFSSLLTVPSDVEGDDNLQ